MSEGRNVVRCLLMFLGDACWRAEDGVYNVAGISNVVTSRQAKYRVLGRAVPITIFECPGPKHTDIQYRNRNSLLHYVPTLERSERVHTR